MELIKFWAGLKESKYIDTSDGSVYTIDIYGSIHRTLNGIMDENEILSPEQEEAITAVHRVAKLGRLIRHSEFGGISEKEESIARMQERVISDLTRQVSRMVIEIKTIGSAMNIMADRLSENTREELL